MYHRMVQEPQPNPLLPGYTFNAYLVAGLTRFWLMDHSISLSTGPAA